MGANGHSDRVLESGSRSRAESAGCLKPIIEGCLVVGAVGLLLWAAVLDGAGRDLAIELAASVLVFAALSIAFSRQLRSWVLGLLLALGIGGMAAGVGVGGTYASSVAINLGAGLAMFVLLETWLALALDGVRRWERGWRDLLSSDFNLGEALERMAADQSATWWGYNLEDESFDEPDHDADPEHDP